MSLHYCLGPADSKRNVSLAFPAPTRAELSVLAAPRVTSGIRVVGGGGVSGNHFRVAARPRGRSWLWRVLICVLAIIVPVPKSHEVETEPSEPRSTEVMRKPKATAPANKRPKKEAKKKR
ncbi:Protein MANBAL [Manis javanica]|nr:Protein MANBAL [Manis javanica]